MVIILIQICRGCGKDMKEIFNREIIESFNSPNTLKVIATTNDKGIPHVAFKDSISINENGEIVLCEIIDSSVTNKNLVYSIWFNRKVSINILGIDKKSYLIEGIPVRAIISGKEFQRYYLYMQRKYGNIDLSTVWIIQPQLIKEETLEMRIMEEKCKHPIINHLDRILKSNY